VKGLARNILQSIPTGVLTVTRSGLITAVNPTAQAVLKRPSLELLGQTFESVFAEGDTVRVVLERALHGHHHLDHKDLPYEDGDRTTRTIRVSTAELTGDDGQSDGVILLAKDVTELLALEQRVRIAEKLAALHTLSAGVAHELRNPLSAVDLNLHLLEEELRDGDRLSPKVQQYLQVLSAESRRLSIILDNFMKFARPGSGRLRQVDVKGLITHLASLLLHEAEERRIRLETMLAEELQGVLGDETQISQVLLNILVNAFQAMPDGGVCRITAKACEVTSNVWVEISVQDTGVGIKSGEQSRLFEPFYTTKTSGSGLGLAIAYRIIQDHGGTIEVVSTPGGGTTVTIKLPAVSLERDSLTVGS
jgi:PAS domain S-box-containing protein